VRCRILLAILLVGVVVPTAAAQPAPVTVDADTITYDSGQRVVTAQGNVRVRTGRFRIFADAARYDLAGGIVTATGRVRILNERGDELTGRALTYNVASDAGMLEQAEGMLDRRRQVFVRAGRIEVSPDRIIAHDSFTTPCDPAGPVFHVTARRIEVVPDQAIIAYDAQVFIANRLIFGAPRFRMSLVPGEAGLTIPALGHTSVDGYWIEARVPLRLDGADGRLNLKYGTRSGIFALLTLTRRDPAFVTTLRAGRAQTSDDRSAFNLLRYDVAEVSVAGTPVRVPGTPLSWSLSASAGWFDDATAGVSTTRLQSGVALSSQTIRLSPQLTLDAAADFTIARYGTGDVRSVTGLRASLAYALDTFTQVIAGYALRGIGGTSPLLVDDVELQNTPSLTVVRAVPDRYRVAMRLSHNATVPETTLHGSVFAVVSPSWELGVSAAYNFRLAAFDDVDYTVRRICDCVDVVLRYRQMRNEFSFEMGLVRFAERGEPFVPRSTPAPPAPAGPDGRSQEDVTH
jgi:hypothetical protein